MNVHLTPELEEFVHTKVQSGRYNSVSDVVREALALLEHRDEILASRKEEIRQQIDEGYRSAGALTDGDIVFDRLEAELESTERIART